MRFIITGSGGCTCTPKPLCQGKTITDNHPIRTVLHSLENVLNIVKDMQIKRLIITHIEEDWGKSYDDYLELEKQYDFLKFAFDGMIIDL